MRKRLVWGSAVLLLAACGRAQPTTPVPIPVPSVSTTPASASPAATASPAPSATSAPAATSTPSPPTPAVTPYPLQSPSFSGPNPNQGLPAGQAAQVAVEEQAPLAFMLSPAGPAVQQALDQLVEPLRQQLARAILNDSTLSSGFASWDTLSGTNQLALLERVATLEAQIMSVQVPPINVIPGTPPEAGEVAAFTPSQPGIGNIALYPAGITANDKFVALDAVVHEMRHAAQYQMLLANLRGQYPAGDPRAMLASAYQASWSAIGPLGGEGTMAYGDYCHLHVEYDAFLTGNEVATIVSQGTIDTGKLGFYDVQVTPQLKPYVDLRSYFAQFTDTPSLVKAINAAEYQAQLTHGASTLGMRHPLSLLSLP